MRNDFYVYCHFCSVTGDIFYVGKGCGDRLHSYVGRSNRWSQRVKRGGFVAKIFKSSLLEDEALELEGKIIKHKGVIDCGGPLLNYIKPVRPKKTAQKKKSRRIVVTMNDCEWREVEDAAQSLGVGVSTYIRCKALHAS